MQTRRTFITRLALAAGMAKPWLGYGTQRVDVLAPCGKTHIPIGIDNTLDTLKTFVEAEGNFSPGFGSYGIYFWIRDTASGKLSAPTMEHLHRTHGLDPPGQLIPWTRWSAGDIEVRTDVCEIRRHVADGEAFIVGSRATVKNSGNKPRKIVIYAALRPIGPAGFNVHHLEVSDRGDALLVDGRTALVAEVPPAKAGVCATDNIGRLALRGQMPLERSAQSTGGNCSGALIFEVALATGETKSFGFICPVLPGRRAARHEWVDLKGDAMVDIAPLNPPTGGILQPDLGLSAYRSMRSADVFREASAYWSQLAEGVSINVPDRRWGEGMKAILSHASLCMNEGAPDVAVVNYNVFNRDGIYVANMLQKSGMMSLATRALDYLINQPFNGRPYPEADNPGQVLWALCQQWLFARDSTWLARVYPSAKKLANLITYCRTTDGPHWVNRGSLDFGDALPLHKREELKSGRCDGFHPEYTEAFDIAGLRAAATLADAIGDGADAGHWTTTAQSLLKTYDDKFGVNLGKDYGSYSVLWPCRLYPLSTGKAHDQLKPLGPQKPQSWGYFPLATAHQSLLAGNRAAGYVTLEQHLSHPQMQGWYAFDEGGESATGGWQRVRTAWPRSSARPADNLSVAMPHGWAIAECWHLMRDCLVFEDGERLVLFAGIPSHWLERPEEIAVKGLYTYFGICSFVYSGGAGVGTLRLTGNASPPDGFVLRWPKNQSVLLQNDGKGIERQADGDFLLPKDTRQAVITFRSLS
jgi:hypothetical protein